MRIAVLAAAAMVALLVQPSIVRAQDGLRSASLPERPIATPPPGPGDLFRATPQTYGPSPSPQPSPYFFPGGIVYGGWPWGYEPSHRERHRREANADRFREERARQDATRAMAETPTLLPPAPSPLPAPVRVAPPKTFYVIPGCYAGDKPPSRAVRGRGCDRSKLQVIPPVVTSVRPASR